MKNLLLLMCLIFFGVTSASELLIEETQSTINSTENLLEDVGDCRWRSCTYDRNGGLIGCTDWTYGICLDELVLKG